MLHRVLAGIVCFLRLTLPYSHGLSQGVPLARIHFKEETISLGHPEGSEGSLYGERSFAALRMTLLTRLRFPLPLAARKKSKRVRCRLGAVAPNRHLTL